MSEETKNEAEETVVVGQTFWDYARMENDDHNLATVTRYVAGREIPDMPTNLQILAEVLKNDGKRVRRCINAKRERERAWKAAQRAKKGSEKKGMSTGQENESTGHTPLSAQLNKQPSNLTEGSKEGKKNKEEIMKEERDGELSALESPKTPVKKLEPEWNIIPPSVEQVRSYCLLRRNKVDPDRFINYWESRGWMMRPGIRMKDWQAAVRTFEQNESNGGASPRRPDGWRKPERDQRDGLQGV